MPVIDKLASSLGRNDEEPNKALARTIAQKNDRRAVRELVDLVGGKDKAVRSDCIKVLYEVGELKPALIAPYDTLFLELLDDPNNRLVWGAMTALDCIAAINPKRIYKHLAKIMAIADQGSVITRDHGVGILIKLAGVKAYADTCTTLLIDQLKTCPTNQLPMYAENALPIVPEKHKQEFSNVLTGRLGTVDKESKRKRIEKVLKKLRV